LDAPLGGEAQLTLRDLTGRISQRRLIRGDQTIQLEIEDLPEGLYLLEYRTGEIQISKKLIIKR
jgi:hypothetical protein